MAEKSAIIVRVDSALRAEIEQVAAEEHRSLANTVCTVLHDWRARRAAARSQNGENRCVA